MKTKHTELPWRVQGKRIEYGPFVAGEGWAVAVTIQERSLEEEQANAAFIVRAVNSYYQMREALQAVDSCGQVLQLAIAGVKLNRDAATLLALSQAQQEHANALVKVQAALAASERES